MPRRRPHVARRPRHLDRRIVDDLLHLARETRRGPRRDASDVEGGLCLGRNDVDAIAGLDHRRRDRRAQHRRMARLAIEEVVVGGRRARRIGADDVEVALGFLRRRDRRQPLEVRRASCRSAGSAASTPPTLATAAARCTTAFDLSGTEPCPEMPRAVSSIARGIFSSVCTDANLTWPPARVTLAAFGQAVLGIDLREMLIDDELDADAGRCLPRPPSARKMTSRSSGDVLPLQHQHRPSGRRRGCPCRRRCRGRRCSRRRESR